MSHPLISLEEQTPIFKTIMESSRTGLSRAGRKRERSIKNPILTMVDTPNTATSTIFGASYCAWIISQSVRVGKPIYYVINS